MPPENNLSDVKDLIDELSVVQGEDQIDSYLEKADAFSLNLGAGDGKFRLVIPKANLVLVREKIDKINKQASKIKADPVILTILREYSRDSFFEKGEIIEEVEIEVEGKVPRIEGWAFIAATDHIYGEESGALIRVVPGKKLPEKFRNIGPICEHCGYSRKRNTTYVLEKDGKYKQIGSTCLRDFSGAGYNPESITQFAFLLETLEREIGSLGYSGHVPSLWEITHVVELAFSMARSYGWVGTSRARKLSSESLVPVTATVGHVREYLYPINRKLPDEIQAQLKKWKLEHAPNEKDKQLAAEEIEYWKNKEDLTEDYAYNVKTIISAGRVTDKFLGTLVSVVARKMKEIRDSDSANYKPSEFFGVEGERSKFTIKIIKIIEQENKFKPRGGKSYIVIFREGDGKIFNNSGVWFASSKQQFEEGDIVELEASIKSHEFREDKKQTVITRGKIININSKMSDSEKIRRSAEVHVVEHPDGSYVVFEINKLGMTTKLKLIKTENNSVSVGDILTVEKYDSLNEDELIRIVEKPSNIVKVRFDRKSRTGTVMSFKWWGSRSNGFIRKKDLTDDYNPGLQFSKYPNFNDPVEKTHLFIGQVLPISRLREISNENPSIIFVEDDVND
jgi:hypothetical protein